MQITNMNQAQPIRGGAKAAVDVILAVAEAIRGLGTVPSGELYAHVCGKLTLAQYEGIVRTLVGAGLVESKAHQLRWIGPQVSA